ncbi:MAG: hypothetical protein JSR59_16100 [Proteobacteria bacterium]|nr:hypothetical protein [Pseudomonadota bacterium]
MAPLVLLWLAAVFGRTLIGDTTPLIERIARRSTPELPPALCRYTRRLTAIWCAYFVLAAAITATQQLSYGATSAVVWGATALLFVGEHRVRARLFPAERFPSLIQQLRDTWSIWRTRP